PTSPNRNRSENSGVSASGFDHLTDLFGRGKNHVRTVAHHSRRHQSRRATLRTILAGSGFQAEIAFPKMSCLAVSRGHTISVVAVGDRLHLHVWFQALQIEIAAAAHHPAH